MHTNAPRRILTKLVLLSVFLTCAGRGEPPVRGPLPEEQKKIIHFLAEHHDELRRKVTLRKEGYAASTTTDNKELAAKLKEHFAYMKKRLGSGAMVRRWDPAFVELVKFHDQLTTEVEYLEDGISVVVTGKTPEAVKVARNHARIITGFTTKGAAAVRERHDAVHDGGKPSPKAGRGRGKQPAPPAEPK
ncbi:MAG: hypothetical protein HKN82_08560 [Akkermansiaceae bacterium]|nr:hypothetical protein [Akkermansiaceae bacterium]